MESPSASTSYYAEGCFIISACAEVGLCTASSNRFVAASSSHISLGQHHMTFTDRAQIRSVAEEALIAAFQELLSAVCMMMPQCSPAGVVHIMPHMPIGTPAARSYNTRLECNPAIDIRYTTPHCEPDNLQQGKKAFNTSTRIWIWEALACQTHLAGRDSTGLAGRQGCEGNLKLLKGRAVDGCVLRIPFSLQDDWRALLICERVAEDLCVPAHAAPHLSVVSQTRAGARQHAESNHLHAPEPCKQLAAIKELSSGRVECLVCSSSGVIVIATTAWLSQVNGSLCRDSKALLWDMACLASMGTCPDLESS